MSHRTGTVVLTLLTVAGPILGAEPPTFDANETLAAYLSEYSDWLDESPANLEAARQELAVTRQALARQASEASVSQAAQLVDAIPKAVDPATSAVERAGLPSFASLFDFGIDSIEAGDEEGSFVVKLNETRLPIGAMGASATVRQATPSEELLAAVIESSRKAIEGGIEAQLQDLDDITYSIQWGLEKGGPWRFGRRIDLYAEELAHEISPIALARMQDRLYGEPTSLVLGDCEERVTRALGGDTWQAFTRDQLADLLGEDELERCLRAARTREDWVVNLDRVLDPLHLIGFLVDNQPQLVVTGLLHDRDPLAGRDGWEVKVEYAHGLCNLNKILNGTGCGDHDEGLALSELKDLEGPGSDLATKAHKGHMFTFSARYAEKDELKVDRTFGTGDDAIALDVSLPEVTEKAAKLQYSRNATWNPRTLGELTVYPKLHVSAEYIDVSDDPNRKDRLVGQLTYEIPLTEGAELPLTLSYANHSEFLGDVDHELSAHIGVSYSIDTGKSKKK